MANLDDRESLPSLDAAKANAANTLAPTVERLVREQKPCWTLLKRVNFQKDNTENSDNTEGVERLMEQC